VTAIVTGAAPTWIPLPRSGGHLSRRVEIRQRCLGLSQRRNVRKLLVKVLPADAIVLVPHDTFGMDLAPGLSIKLESPFRADVVDIEGPTAAPAEGGAPGIRRNGQHPRDLRYFQRCGVNLRPGLFRLPRPIGRRQVEDKSGEAAT
jgi:electron transfer flavoprotein alpha subunit